MSSRHAASPASPDRAGGVRRLLAALGALAALGVLLVGVPFALVQLGSWPITGVPTGEQIRDLPSTVVTDDAVIAILTVVLWLAWAVFVASVLVEVVAQVRARARGEDRPARSGGGPVQAVARYLVGSLLMSVAPLTAAGTAMPVGAATIDTPPAAHAEFAAFWAPQAADSGVGHVLDLDVEDPSWEAALPGASEVTSTAATLTVGRGDTAWSLAADHLGDGARWREIWEANRTRTQPDGAVWAEEDQPVEAGWTLVMPGVEGDGVATLQAGSPSLEEVSVESPNAEAATPPVQALAAAPAVAAEVTVQPGDNFWDLAEGQLTEAWGRAPTDAEVVPHWQALVESNRQSLVPPGDPDLIHPGQVFSVPTPPAAPEVQGLVSGVVLGEPVPEVVPEAAPDCDPPEVAPAPPATTGRRRARPACADDDRDADDDRGTDDDLDHRPRRGAGPARHRSAAKSIPTAGRRALRAGTGLAAATGAAAPLPHEPTTDSPATDPVSDDDEGGLTSSPSASSAAASRSPARSAARTPAPRPAATSPPRAGDPAPGRRGAHGRTAAPVGRRHPRSPLLDVALRAAAASAGATGLPRLALGRGAGRRGVARAGAPVSRTPGLHRP